MRKLLFLLLNILLFNYAVAKDQLKDHNDVIEHSKSVMHALEKSDILEAFILLQKYWPLPENEITQLETLTIKQFNLVADRFGEIIGTNFIREQQIMDFALKQTYVLRFENHMIRVFFTYYKSKEGWILNGFKWDDKFDELFE
jgi:hypothetical protein